MISLSSNVKLTCVFILLPLISVSCGLAPEALKSPFVKMERRVEKGSETEPAFSPAPTVYCYADVRNRTIVLAINRGMIPLKVFGISICDFDGVHDPAMPLWENPEYEAVVLRGIAQITGPSISPDL